MNNYYKYNLFNYQIINLKNKCDSRQLIKNIGLKTMFYINTISQTYFILNSI